MTVPGLDKLKFQITYKFDTDGTLISTVQCTSNLTERRYLFSPLRVFLPQKFRTGGRYETWGAGHYLIHRNADELNTAMPVDACSVMSFDQTGKALGEYVFDTSDAALQKLIDQLNSRDPAAVEAAQLWRQPGSYRCSLPEIDLMVDLACSVPGVAGAQLAGAGLGGCMMVLAHKDCVDELQSVLTNQYYRPRNLEPYLLHCRPIAGAGAISF